MAVGPVEKISRGFLFTALLALALAACGGSGHGAATTSATPLTLDQVRRNLQKRDYKLTVWSPGEGALQLDQTHSAQAGFSVDYAPSGQQIYGAVYETSDPAVRRVLIAQNSDDPTPIVRGDLVFTISGTAPELQTIVNDAGDAAPSTAQSTAGSSADSQAARAAMQHFIDVYAAADEKALCASFTPRARAHSQTFCDPASIFYKRRANPSDKQYSITAVTTSGSTATATVSYQGVTEQVALEKIDGRWKIDTQLGEGQLF